MQRFCLFVLALIVVPAFAQAPKNPDEILPVLSPDGKYYAVQVWQSQVPVPGTDVPPTKIRVYNVESGKVVRDASATAAILRMSWAGDHLVLATTAEVQV